MSVDTIVYKQLYVIRTITKDKTGAMSFGPGRERSIVSKQCSNVLLVGVRGIPMTVNRNALRVRRDRCIRREVVQNAGRKK